MAGSPFGTFNGVEPFAIFPGVGLHPIAGDQVFLGRVAYEPGTTVKRHSHEHTEQAMLVLEGSLTMTIGDETQRARAGRRVRRQPRRRARALLGARRHVHRGARAGAARPHRRSRARPRARRPERVAARRALTRRRDVESRQGRARHRREPRHRRGDGGAAAPRRLAGRDGRARDRRRPRASPAPAPRPSSGSTGSTRSSATPARPFAQGVLEIDARGVATSVIDRQPQRRCSSSRRRPRGGWSTRAAARSCCSPR